MSLPLWNLDAIFIEAVSDSGSCKVSDSIQCHIKTFKWQWQWLMYNILQICHCHFGILNAIFIEAVSDSGSLN